MLKLTDSEKAMLDGRHGKARQKAMELLVRYAEALGAERFVDTRNVAGVPGRRTPSFSATTPAKTSTVAMRFSRSSTSTPTSSSTFRTPSSRPITCKVAQTRESGKRLA